jgi:hypothetical protein
LGWRHDGAEGAACLRIGAQDHRVEIALGPGSLIAPAVIVGHPWKRAHEGRREAIAIALSSAAWDGCAEDPPHLWCALDPGTPATELSAAELGLEMPPALVLARLAAAAHVVAPPGPLAWDAFRLGLAVDSGGLPLDVDALADLLPPVLSLDADFWRRLVERFASQLGSPSPVAPMLDAMAIRAARDSWPPPSASGKARSAMARKALKLIRDPRRFLVDSRWWPRFGGRR